MKNKEQWKKLMSVRGSLDRFAKDKFKLNLKKNPDVESFATLTELPLRMLIRYVALVSIDVEQFLSDLSSSMRQRFTIKNIEMMCYPI